MKIVLLILASANPNVCHCCVSWSAEIVILSWISNNWRVVTETPRIFTVIMDKQEISVPRLLENIERSHSFFFPHFEYSSIFFSSFLCMSFVWSTCAPCAIVKPSAPKKNSDLAGCISTKTYTYLCWNAGMTLLLLLNCCFCETKVACL